jgi:septal ring factor EnvC (AmiA/AmiB activator)
MHTGMDIAAPTGQTIVAAAGGRIIFAGWYGGYGNAIIIDHGGQTSTLYGHCSQIFVAVGQEMQRGQAIGAVGQPAMRPARTCTSRCASTAFPSTRRAISADSQVRRVDYPNHPGSTLVTI